MPSRRAATEVFYLVAWFILIVIVCAAPAGAQYTFSHLAGSTGAADAIDGSGTSARFNAPGGVAVDSTGNVFVADTWNHTIRKITPSGVVTTFAGLAGVFGSTDGPGSLARLCYPTGIAFDSSGNLFVADYGFNTIRKITPAGVVTTFAGLSGSSGSVDGTGSAARFNGPYGVAVDGADSVYVSEYFNRTIRKITPGGVVTTFAGTAGVLGSADGTGPAAQFGHVRGLGVDSGGNLYVADTSNSRIRKITPGAVVTTLASGTFGIPATGVALDAAGNLFAAEQDGIEEIAAGSSSITTFAGFNLNTNFADGTGGAAGFNAPSAITIDAGGNLYVADSGNHNIRKITPSKVVTTLAGGVPTTGGTDGPGSAAQFNTPEGIAVDAGGTVWVADKFNDTIRKITAAGVVSTFAGTAGSSGNNDATGSAASFALPHAIAVDASGNAYVAANSAVRKITTGAVVTTLAGTSGSSGYVDATGTAARFNGPEGLAVDSGGNVYAVDDANTVRKISPGGVVTTFAGSSAAPVFGATLTDGTGTAATFFGPKGVAIDAGGTLWVADELNYAIRKVTTPAAAVTTFAFGSGTIGSAWGVAVDASGNVYYTLPNNNTVRKITPAGAVSTIGGVAGTAGNLDGTGSAALFNSPVGIAVDSSGAIYVADAHNNAIRKGVPAIADTATIDSASGKPGTMRLLGVSPNTASTWLWEEIRRPSASTASLSSTSTPSPTFTPDVAGLYVFRLTASSSTGARVSTVSLSSGLFLSGDINGDGSVSAADIFYLINNLFVGGPAPVGPGDVNGDGSVTAADIFYLINYLFAGGAAPR